MERDTSEPVHSDQGRVVDSVDDPRFPKVVGRTRQPIIPTALEIADPAQDPITFKSASRMIAGE